MAYRKVKFESLISSVEYHTARLDQEMDASIAGKEPQFSTPVVLRLMLDPMH